MKRIVLAFAAVLSLSACNLGGIGSAPPPTLVKTTIDEKAITLTAQAVDVAALSLSAMARTGVITPGSPTALKIADALDRARDLVNSAAAARRAGNATSYAQLLDEAKSALAQASAAINTVGR